MNMLERNKKNVVAFYDLMFNQSKPREAMERFASDTYIQHNPGVAESACTSSASSRKETTWSCIATKIVEHWDVLQIVPLQSANANTMF